MAISKKQILECIELIEYMDVQVNYRDKMFVEAAGLKSVKKQNHEKAGTKKVKYSFYDILIKLSDDKRIELEEKYRKKKNRYALAGDDRLVGNKAKNIEGVVPDAKEQIAKAFIPFIDEVQKELNELITKNLSTIAEDYLQMDTIYAKQDGQEINKYNRGLHLVYRNLKSREAFYTEAVYDDFGEDLTFNGEALDYEKVPSDDEYSFSTLPALLNVIAEVTTKYCKEMDIIQGIDRTEVLVGQAKRGQVAPLFIRQSCAWVCYTLLYFGDAISKYFKQEPLTTKSGVCSQIMHDLHLRTKKNFGYEYFAKEKKLFEYNKWSILPERILREGNFLAPVSPVNYAGHKSGYLGFMLQSLVDQRSFDTYIEPFGGSGIGITQFHKKEGVKYYISDGNYANMCFYRVLKGSDENFNEFKKNLKEKQKSVRKLYKKIDKVFPPVANKGQFGWTKEERENYQSYFKDMTKIRLDNGRTIADLYVKDKGFDSSLLSDLDVEFFFYNPDYGTYDVKMTDNDFKDRKQDVISVLEVYFELRDLYKPLIDVYNDCGENYNKEEELDKVKQSEVELAVIFVTIHTSLVSGAVSVPSVLKAPKFKNIDIDKDFNRFRYEYQRGVTPVPNVKYGVDAMKLLTDVTYNKSTSFAYLDSPYLNSAGYSIGFKIEDMEDLLIACSGFKGDFVFSCRANLPSAALDDSISKDTFVVYFDMWLKLKALFESHNRSCKVLFMKDGRDLQLSKETYAYLFRNNLATDNYVFLAECIESGSDLEIMITNFDFEVADYDKFADRIIEKGKEEEKIIEAQKKSKKKSSHEKVVLTDKYLVKVDIEDIVKLVKYIYR